MTDNPLPYAALLSDRQAALEKRVARLEQWRAKSEVAIESVMADLNAEPESEPLPQGDLD